MLKIGVFSDVHLRKIVPGDSTNDRIASRLMHKRVCDSLKAMSEAKVDLVICCGDLIDIEHEKVPLDLELMREAMSEVDAPKIVIPGNHAPHNDDFYNAFHKPPDKTTIKGYDFITFIDEFDRETQTAKRSDTDLQRLARETETESDSPLLFVVQHYPVYPNLTDYYGKKYHFNYTNAGELRKTMENSQRRIFSISGHYHPGFGPEIVGNCTYFVAKAMCEQPYPYYLVSVQDDEAIIGEIGSCDDAETCSR